MIDDSELYAAQEAEIQKAVEKRQELEDIEKCCLELYLGLRKTIKSYPSHQGELDTAAFLQLCHETRVKTVSMYDLVAFAKRRYPSSRLQLCLVDRPIAIPVGQGLGFAYCKCLLWQLLPPE